MGALKSVNNIDIHYQYADFSVETPGYWKLRAHNDFDNGDLVKVNGVPTRDYHHKQILKFDFSKLGDAFTDSVRMTLTNLLNEVFVTLFADNQPFISAVTPGSYDAPLTYSLALEEGIENIEKCIFIIEDSQLDIGLLIAVERNVNRILQIISDYLAWNDEQIAESVRKQNAPAEEKKEAFDAYAEDTKTEKKKGFFGRIGDWFKKLFKKKDKKQEAEPEDGLTPRQRKKAEKAAAKEAKAAAKAAKEAEKQAAREQKKAQKQEEKLRKEQEKAAKKEAKAAEKAAEEIPDEEPAADEVSGDESVAEEETPNTEQTEANEETTVEDVSEESETEEQEQAESEGEVNEDA